MPTPLATPAEQLEYALVVVRYMRDLINTAQFPQLAAVSTALNALDLSVSNPLLSKQLAGVMNGPLKQALVALAAAQSTPAVQLGVTTS